MIIVEGADLVGKTTFAKKLVTSLCNNGYHHIYKHLSRLPEKWDYYWSYLSEFSYSTVQDRFHDSELAYANARGDTTFLDHRTYRLLDAWIQSRGTVSIVICADESLIRSRFEETGDDMYDIDIILKANEWFIDNRDSFDVAISCDDEKQFPSDTMAAKIVQNYMQYSDHYRNIVERRPFYAT